MNNRKFGNWRGEGMWEAFSNLILVGVDPYLLASCHAVYFAGPMEGVLL